MSLDTPMKECSNLFLSSMSYWPGNSCNLVFANPPTEKKSLLFFFLQRALLILLLYIPASVCRKAFFPSAYFLVERTVCVHLYPTLHMTKLQRGCFDESRGYDRREPTTNPTGFTTRRVPPVSPGCPHTCSQAQRVKPVSDIRSN